MISACLMWLIWQEHNKRIFEDIESPLDLVKSLLVGTLFDGFYTWPNLRFQNRLFSFLPSLGGLLYLHLSKNVTQSFIRSLSYSVRGRESITRAQTLSFQKHVVKSRGFCGKGEVLVGGLLFSEDSQLYLGHEV